MIEENKKIWDVDTNKSTTKSDNIFKELSGDLDFWKDLDNTETKDVKDKLYYLKLSSNIFSFVNIIVVFMVLSSFLYTYIQNDPEFYDKSYLNPVCYFLIWDIENDWSNCSWAAALLNNYTTKTNDLKNVHSEKISEIIEDLYTINNFSQSPEIEFLSIAKNLKIKPLDILNEFDKLKNDFSRGDKESIQCENFVINSSMELTASCTAYSSSWEKVVWNEWWIIWYNWNKSSNPIEWTSISVAASFLNYIDLNRQYNFKLLEKPTSFSAENVIWEGPYVKKTSFNIRLKYNALNNLSL